MSSDTIRLRVESDISALTAAQWNACANPADALDRDPDLKDEKSPYNPFVSYEFLSALEESGSVGARTGWHPQHLVLEGEGGQPLALCPAYLKTHSQGEYVFDHGWADAYERAGGQYYPKLQVSVPFTPATGPRLLVRPGAHAAAAKRALAQGLATLCDMRRASSVHATFLTETDAAVFDSEGWLPRIDQQFHWTNRGYGSFDDFLGELASRKRKAIRRERRDALADGIDIKWLTGREITEADWDAFFAFYMETGSRKWGRPYLNRRFYSLIGERMADRILLVMARRGGRSIAGAINFIGSDTLYGRHWGCIEEHPFLHFEVCYHQAIDFAIARGLSTVEAGAQGEHKLARGYLPVTTRSAHFIADPGFREAVAAYLARERSYSQEAQAELAAQAPFRRDHDEP
ncbi:putative N-acyltransferase [Ancylobacter sp. 3268]|uniref:GNAT family N-acetyltransferase n=1 Tax=Ancylobacter sp. 3268 TaxID=2817752 RepID=UPI002862050E|nr:GNAT family N-acetyltransferase [Ancylobacter sp. 3268]MDR6950909.1 putative N-acyltransferase [Ancylobacter sp. 3268]